MENHQDGGDRSRGRREGYGRLYSLHEAFLSHWGEALEDVEGSRKSSKFPMVFLRLTHLLTSSMQADRLESQMRVVRKLDLSHLCFFLNFLFLYVLRNFPLCFPY